MPPKYQYRSPKTRLVSTWIDATDERSRAILEMAGWTITATRGDDAPPVVAVESVTEAPAVAPAAPPAEPAETVTKRAVGRPRGRKSRR